MATFADVFTGSDGKKLYRGRSVALVHLLDGSFGVASSMSARSTGNRKYEPCGSTGAVRVVPTKSADPKRNPNDSLHFYNVIVPFKRSSDETGLIAGNGIQTDEIYRSALVYLGHGSSGILSTGSKISVPRMYYNSRSNSWEWINIMAHEPDTDSGGVYQCTSRISALVLQGERGLDPAMLTSFCQDTSKPKCYQIDGVFPDPEIRDFSFEMHDVVDPGHGRVLMTYTGETINGRLMPMFDDPIDVRLTGRNAQEIAEELRAAMNPDHFLAVACMIPGKPPVIINKED